MGQLRMGTRLRPPIGDSLAEAFRARMIGAFGEAGRRWLTEVDQLIEECAAAWDLEVCDPFPDPSYQIVLPVMREAGRLALKMGVPRDELREEATTLRAWDARGTVRLVADDQARGALLLERIEPGDQLADLAATDDDAATEAGAAALRAVAEAGVAALARDPGLALALPPLARWGDGFDRYLDAFPDWSPIPRPTIERAAAMFASLVESTTAPAILHGDLHHHNILDGCDAPTRWVVIDPKGIVGDPAFEAGAFLRNPGVAFGTGVDGAARTRRRLDALTDLTGHDRRRMADWGWAGSVLSAAWCVEEEGLAGKGYAWPVQVAAWIDLAR